MYKGRLSGDAPALEIIRSSDTVHYLTNCNVAVKMLPAHASAEAIEDFHNEMDFMKVSF